MQWEVPEYENKKRPQDWYWAVSVIVVALAIAALIFANAILSLFVFLAGATLILFAIRDPDMLLVSLTEQGVIVNNKLYPFAVFDSFWVEEHEQPVLLILKTEQVYSPLVLIPLHDTVEPDSVREYLLEYIDEEEIDVPLSRKILEFLGF